MKNISQLKQWLFDKPAIFSLMFFGLVVILGLIFSAIQALFHFETLTPIYFILGISFIYSVYYMIKKLPHDKLYQSDFVAITNGGGIRAPISAGDVTKKDVKTVLPFGNTVEVVYVTGAELLEALEASTYCTPNAVGGYPQTAGIKFTLDTKKSFAKGPAYPASTYYKPASINRVSIQSINGQPFSLTDTYAVVTNNFCAAGGDTYYVFNNASSQFDTGIPMDEAVMDYVKEVLGGTITAAKYGSPRGDQTQITTGLANAG